MIRLEDCMQFKKSVGVNFLFSKTRSALPCIFFENLIVFFEEIVYDTTNVTEKGWEIESLVFTSDQDFFEPFSILTEMS